MRYVGVKFATVVRPYETKVNVLSEPFDFGVWAVTIISIGCLILYFHISCSDKGKLNQS